MMTNHIGPQAGPVVGQQSVFGSNYDGIHTSEIDYRGGGAFGEPRKKALKLEEISGNKKK